MMGVGEGFVVRGVTLFDGQHLVHDRDVVVHGSNIVSVTPTSSQTHELAVIDGIGRTLLPGLIDAHVHCRPPDLAQMALRFGVTTVLDMGSEPHVMGAYRAEAQVRHDMADIRTSSTAATPPGGHPAMLVGLLFERQLPPIEHPWEADAFVNARLAEGADYIKLVIEDGTAFGIPMPVLSPETTSAIVRAAHDRHVLAVAHVHTRESARQAVVAGCDGLVHLFVDGVVDDDLLELMVARGTFVTPTLTLLESMAGIASGAGIAFDPSVSPYLSPEWTKNLSRAWRLGGRVEFDAVLESVRLLKDAGVPLLAGTDSGCCGVFGTAPGVSMHRELQLLTQAGLSAIEAIHAATAAPAFAFGLDDRGRIEPGMRADLFLVDGNPTECIEDTVRIAAIWRGGHRADRDLKPESR